MMCGHYIYYHIRIQKGAQHLVMEAKEKFYPDRIYPHIKFVACITFCRSRIFLRLFQDILCAILVWLERNTACSHCQLSKTGWGGTGNEDTVVY